MTTDDWGIDENWEAKIRRYLELSEGYADAKAEMENLKNVKQTVLAVAASKSTETSEAGRKRDADQSEAYVKWCVEYKVAVKHAEWYRLRLKAMDLWFEMQRTHAATKRAEMTHR